MLFAFKDRISDVEQPQEKSFCSAYSGIYFVHVGTEQFTEVLNIAEWFRF